MKLKILKSNKFLQLSASYGAFKKETRMIRQITILVLVLTISLSSRGQKRVENKDRMLSSTSLQIDTSVIAVLPFDTTQNWLFIDSKPVELTNADLTQIEKLLKECVDNYNPEQERQFNEIKAKDPSAKIYKKHFVIDLTEYKRQYVAVTNDKGEKEVWINCFCDTWGKNWRKEQILVKDGGNCYFNLKINLTKGEYYELTINGEA
jgi:hypothetical protein